MTPPRDTVVRTLPATVLGRYLVETPGGAGRPLLVGFHGYGENAEVQLAALRRLPGTQDWLRVSVQALHPFYRRSTGQVVASWLTRLDREAAIRDNVAYLGSVLDAVEREQCPGRPRVYVGFSQGVATACRTAARSGHACDGLLLLGGELPPDVSGDPEAPLPPLLLARGQQDPWYTEDKLARDRQLLAARGATWRELVFPGGHEWSPAFLEAAGAFLESLAAAAPTEPHRSRRS